ncbi:Rossmann-like and DUF2520 domain-containing protein [Pedobacter panaciterrae]|jgi:predicted short-subunit dehydrogenase-like oxidoreductase (DUF2520 family)|uniref:DUF2520 domain-containing protein n=1 Tax=Pedobacter panaciterrae TaxID=363849 RepID=A0ABU8NKM9_9SPHI|nr:Rossmann-like and DUF2520 domain-containing protein [Pedobacter panaciterrae]NQX53802.1 DUF2520 domain-containing protein [Pedobacter panaciterrae]
MKVVCIGSGNVATHLANALKAKGVDLIQIWSRDLANASELAKNTNSVAISNLDEIDRSADLYIVAVKDDAIASVSDSLREINGLVVHTSGATSIDALSALKNYGVLYPLQTFSKAKPIDFANVPLCIEASNVHTLEVLRSVADMLSSPVYEVDSEKRKILHLAAVFACNFVNHLYTLSDKIVEHFELDFEMLKPLIMETALKVQTELPINVQTGPAVRDDEQTMIKHQVLLNGMPELKEIYQTLSKSIKKTHL